jgi:hypothetical protein
MVLNRTCDTRYSGWVDTGRTSTTSTGSYYEDASYTGDYCSITIYANPVPYCDFDHMQTIAVYRDELMKSGKILLEKYFNLLQKILIKNMEFVIMPEFKPKIFKSLYNTIFLTLIIICITIISCSTDALRSFETRL